VSNSGKRYQLKNKINRGSFGLIFEAISLDSQNGNFVIKIINGKDKNDLEIEFLNKVKDHDITGISKIIDWGFLSKQVEKRLNFESNSKFIVLEKLGQSMKDIMNGRSKILVRDILKLGIDLIKTIEKLHNLGICHYDIKPDNVMTKFPIF
jgi:serine/threonine protein kinase